MKTTQTFKFSTIPALNSQWEREYISCELIDKIEPVMYNGKYLIKFEIDGVGRYLPSSCSNGLVEIDTEEQALDHINTINEALVILKEKYNCFLKGEIYVPEAGIRSFEIRQSAAYQAQLINNFEARVKKQQENLKKY